MKLRNIMEDKAGNVDMVIMAVVAAVVFAISIAIVYSVLGGIDYTAYDAAIGVTGTTPAANASDNLITNLNTFYQIGPIYIIVIAAVAIIGAILVLRAKETK